MRIRITKPVRGDVDGVRLTTFQVGQTYEVSTTVGTYLIMMAGAEPVADPTTPVTERGIGEQTIIIDPGEPIY